MWESILFSLKLVLNANEASKEMHLTRQEQNRCLAANECVAIYDTTTQAWIVRKRETLIEKDISYNNLD
jgi:hypothetical protein